MPTTPEGHNYIPRIPPPYQHDVTALQNQINQLTLVVKKQEESIQDLKQELENLKGRIRLDAYYDD